MFRIVSKSIPEEVDKTLVSATIIHKGETRNNWRALVNDIEYPLTEDSLKLRNNVYFISNEGKNILVMQGTGNKMKTNETMLSIYSNFKDGMIVRGKVIGHKFKVCFKEDKYEDSTDTN